MLQNCAFAKSEEAQQCRVQLKDVEKQFGFVRDRDKMRQREVSETLSSLAMALKDESVAT